MLERQQRDILAPKTPKTVASTPVAHSATPASSDAIGRLADPTKIEDVVDEDNSYAVFVGEESASERVDSTVCSFYEFVIHVTKWKKVD